MHNQRTGSVKSAIGEGEAQDLAVEALGFLANDEEQLSRFLSVFGLGPENLRAAASEPGFFAAVLDYICKDDSLVLTFAANAGIDPDRIAQARVRLAGPENGGE